MTKEECRQKINDIDTRISNLLTMQQKYDSLGMRDAAMRTNGRINEVLDEKRNLEQKLKSLSSHKD